jgi:hypothetical protein
MARSDLLTIPNGEQNSNEISLGSRSPMAVLILSPTTLAEAVNIRVWGKTNNALLKSGTTEIELTADGAQMVMIFHAEKLRLEADSGVAEARVFEILWSLTGEIG